LKIFQGCWITSLTGINFKSNRINSRKRPDKTEISESESYDFENTNVQVITEKMPKKSKVYSPTRKHPKTLASADPIKYRPKDFYVKNKSDSESLSTQKILQKPPIQQKLYSSYNKKNSVSEFKYRDYSFGDFNKDQRKLLKRCNKKLMTLDLPVFVEDGSAEPVITQLNKLN